ncbi:MAG: peptidylprolyl isomerase [Gemmatimonadota bacterium]
MARLPGGERGRAVWREPTVHFVLIALLMFGAHTATQRIRGADRVEIRHDLVLARAAQIEAAIGLPLTPDELQRLEDNFIDEQILVREARLLGLDDDPQVHDLLAQKMLDVLSAGVLRPSRAELESFYAQHRAAYSSAPRVWLTELIVPAAHPGSAALAAALQSGSAPADLPGASTLQASPLDSVSSTDLQRIFGDSMATRVLAASPTSWVGPYTSVRGQHWLWVASVLPGSTPPLDSISAQVRVDWVAERESTVLREKVDELRERYTIVFVDENER